MISNKDCAKIAYYLLFFSVKIGEIRDSILSEQKCSQIKWKEIEDITFDKFNEYYKKFVENECR